jgi:beta-galactosidase
MYGTKKQLIVAAALLTAVTMGARGRVSLDKGWRFMLADSMQMALPSYNDAHWRRVDVPHDWAIEGDFYAGNKSGAGGGALPGGVGWYRRTLNITAEEGHRLLTLDGVYMNAAVYVNGQKIGQRPYGYTTVTYDITAALHEGDNLLAIRVDNSDQPNSRWYSGCGIYRHTWLTTTGLARVKTDGVRVVSTVNGRKGEVNFSTELVGEGTVSYRLTDADGRVVGSAGGRKARIRVKNPRLWSPESPYVYKVTTTVRDRWGRVSDEQETWTGFRTIRWDAQTGFWLNGQHRKLNGVCEHHDLGCLGAALNEDALHRKLLKLKRMGANAIRTSHNPPAPELLTMCDTMGLMVMDESFDMWRRRKTQNDYARYFDEWHERDLRDLIRRDRNHPSVIMWSIGNEVLEQWADATADTLTLEQANLLLNAGHEADVRKESARDGENSLSVQSLMTQHLANIVREEDDTRAVTAGCNEPSPNNHLFRSGALDVIGFNYHHQWMKEVSRNFPGMPFILTESVSALQTRGYYMMPSDSVYTAPKEWWLPYTDPSFMCSAYDNMHASWSSTHEESWDVVKHTPGVGGQFIWTGFDYIGEPTPYGFPARSSYFGVVDLAGLEKDAYYMYQSEWTQGTPVLHLLPHWNWRKGQTIDVWAYYNEADEVELFVNGKSQGVRRKDDHTYHVWWRLTYEPGELKAVSRKNGKIVKEETVRTAGAAAGLRLTKDYVGRELTFVRVDIIDRDGNLCPWADDQVWFSTQGDGKVVATDNGCQTSMERFQEPKRKAFHGKCIVVLKGHGRLNAETFYARQQLDY